MLLRVALLQSSPLAPARRRVRPVLWLRVRLPQCSRLPARTLLLAQTLPRQATRLLRTSPLLAWRLVLLLLALQLWLALWLRQLLRCSPLPVLMWMAPARIQQVC